MIQVSILIVGFCCRDTVCKLMESNSRKLCYDAQKLMLVLVEVYKINYTNGNI